MAMFWLSIHTYPDDASGTDGDVSLSFSADGVPLGSVTISGAGKTLDSKTFQEFRFEAPDTVLKADRIGLKLSSKRPEDSNWKCASIGLTNEERNQNIIFLIDDWIRQGERRKYFSRADPTDATELHYAEGAMYEDEED